MNGGAICNNYGATLILNDGNIVGNIAAYGGGIYNDGTFTMNGGNIIGNYCYYKDFNGVGVYNSGSFTLNNGVISKNNSADSGGGVGNFETFTMNGGSITENTSDCFGTGVVVRGKTYLLDGKISDNKTTDSFHSGPNGVLVMSSDTLTIGGEIVIDDNICIIDKSDSGYPECTVTISSSGTKSLSGKASIGIMLFNNHDASCSGTFMSTSDSGLTKYFHAADTNYGVIARKDEKDPTIYNYNVENIYTVTYDLNGADGTAPTDSNVYFSGDSAEISSTKPTRNGYKFLGWNTDKDATAALTFDNNKLTIGSSNITLYAVWESLEYTGNISITITDLKYGLNTSYISITSKDDDLKVKDKLFVYIKDNDSNPITFTKVEDPGTYMICFVLESSDGLYFGGGEQRNEKISDVAKQYCTSYSSLTVNNNSAYSFGCAHYNLSSCESIEYYSEIDNNNNLLKYNNKYLYVVTTFTLTGNSVSYDDNVTDSSVTNMPIDETTYLENEPVSISQEAPTREGYKFLGWSTSSTATEAQTFTDGKFTMGSSNVVLYAVWQEKTDVSISETSQSGTYNGNGQSYEIKGTHKDIDDFDIKYYVDGSYSGTAPTNVGSYNVKITRVEDDTYKAYSKEITNGLVINEAKVNVIANDITMNLGDTVPEFTASESGIVNGDKLTYTFNSLNPTAQGAYTIIPSGSGKQGNYIVSYSQGTLTVTKQDSDAKVKSSDISEVLETYQSKSGYNNKTLDIEVRTDGNVLQTDKDLINQEVTSEKKIIFNDTELYLIIKDGNNRSEKNIGDENDNLISITYKFNFVNKKDIQVLRVHNNVVDELSETANSNGEYVTFDRNNGTITITAKKYSTYAFVYNEVISDNSSGYKIVYTGVDETNNSSLKLISLMSLVTVAGIITLKKRKDS